MRIGLISDTHSNIQVLRRIVHEAPPVEMWLHAGDHYQEANVLEQLTGVKVIAVQATNYKGDEVAPTHNHADHLSISRQGWNS